MEQKTNINFADKLNRINTIGELCEMLLAKFDKDDLFSGTFVILKKAQGGGFTSDMYNFTIDEDEYRKRGGL